MGPERAWDDARAKVEIEGCCRACGATSDLEAAHIAGRKHDGEETLRGQTHKGGKLWVAPTRVVPLCRDCHRHYDAHELDLLPHLNRREQAQAVLDLGLTAAWRRLTGNREGEPRLPF